MRNKNLCFSIMLLPVACSIIGEMQNRTSLNQLAFANQSLNECAICIKNGEISQRDINRATNVYKRGGLVYIYGQKVTINDFLTATGSDFYCGDCVDNTNIQKALEFSSISSEDLFSIISGYDMRQEFGRWKQEIVSFENVPTDSDLLTFVNDDFQSQRKRENPQIKKEVVRIKSSTGVKCYLDSSQTTYLYADWTLLQDVDEMDEEQNYFGFTTLITPVSSLLPCGLVYVQQRVMNSGGVLSDYAPSDSTDVTLNVGVSAGTSGVDVSVSANLTSRPTFIAQSYPDRTAAAFEWLPGSIVLPGGLNNVGFRSGIAWHANTTYPSVKTTFYGSFGGLTTSTKTITASKLVEDIH